MAVGTTLRRHWKGALASAVVAVAALAVGVPYVYIHFIEGPAPAPFTLPTATATAATTTGGTATLAGIYRVGPGSLAGYRVQETLAGQHATAVGRTSQVTGSMTIAGHTVTKASFTVDMASVTSDRSQRDDQFRGRIMDVAQFPTGSFTLTKPIQLSSVPPVGTVVTEQASGDLTLRGTTRPETLTLQAERTASGVDITGLTTITYGDFGIDNPSFGGFVSVGNSGAVEVSLKLIQQ